MVTEWHLRPARDAGWMRDAACRDHDPDMWFPEDEPDPRRRDRIRARARDICLTCPVALACRDHASATGTTAGIWAGRDHGRPGGNPR